MNRIHFIFFFLVMVAFSSRSYAAPVQHQKTNQSIDSQWIQQPRLKKQPPCSTGF